METSVKERLKQFIKDSCIKGTDFCDSIGVSQSYISGIRESIQPDKLYSIAINYPNLNIEWLVTGLGNMFKTDTISTDTRPRIPYNAKAGVLTESISGVRGYECEQIPVISAFPHYDFTIRIKGDSMQPDYCSGDEVACAIIKEPIFLQWGRVHVLDTEQGVVIKKIYDDGENIRCKSINTDEYPDFSIPKEKIRLFALVVGQLRLK